MVDASSTSSSSMSCNSQATPQHCCHCGGARTRWQHILPLLIVTALMLPCSTSGFSMTMEYKPPVKSSVGKIRNSRFSESRSRSTSSQSRSPTHKSAYAGALVPPPSSMMPPTTGQRPRSFEDRMRDLVLGPTTKPKKPAAAAAAPRARSKPANIKMVETLADFKSVVADEKDRIVAVRFHAPWCRVSQRCPL